VAGLGFAVIVNMAWIGFLGFEFFKPIELAFSSSILVQSQLTDRTRTWRLRLLEKPIPQFRNIRRASSFLSNLGAHRGTR